ncbi:MAG TPA: Uma2 family endonuclease [Fimbriiglobus sp.]|nr:Uma2 family endonuclease [Fimbriiglobus sp.]
MSTAATPDPQLVRMYERAEQDYLRSLPLEHFMEATDHATQREITLESFALIRAHRPDVQCFNELLVQYPRGKRKKLGQVVPDNMVVVHPVPIEARGSFNLSLQPAAPFLVLEYVSKYNKRKDYDDNYEKYHKELRVPYYLLFYPDNQDLTVFRQAGGKYVSVTPNEYGRLAIPELELEAALLDSWVRFWFRGELLPLPGELLMQLNAEQQARVAAERRAADAETEVARLREELARAKQP